MTLAIANYAVAALNIMTYATSHEMRDMMAAIAWSGSGTYWLWQAMQG